MDIERWNVWNQFMVSLVLVSLYGVTNVLTQIWGPLIAYAPRPGGAVGHSSGFEHKPIIHWPNFSYSATLKNHGNILNAPLGCHRIRMECHRNSWNQTLREINNLNTEQQKSINWASKVGIQTIKCTEDSKQILRCLNMAKKCLSKDEEF